MPKKISKYDLDGDGVVADTELEKSEKLIALENLDKKEDQLRQMAWVAMISMLIFTIILFLPFIPVDRIAALDNLLGMFYIAQAGIVASFFGTSAYMTVNKM
jgi:hypothetical protein